MIPHYKIVEGRFADGWESVIWPSRKKCQAE
jgi:hypothetical protein